VTKSMWLKRGAGRCPLGLYPWAASFLARRGGRWHDEPQRRTGIARCRRDRPGRNNWAPHCRM